MTAKQRLTLTTLVILSCLLIAFFFVPIPTHAVAVDMNDLAKAEAQMQSMQMEMRLLQIAYVIDLLALGWIARMAWCIVRGAMKRPTA